MTERSPSPTSALERTRVISECYEKARAYLDSHRIRIDDGFIDAKKNPHGTRDIKYKKAEILNDRAEVQRLETAFELNRARESEAERRTYDENKKISDIFEAMFADIAKQIFGGDVEVIVPSHFDDFKRQTDLIIVFKDSAGKPEATIVVDFTTQQDVDGYTDEDGHRGGLEVKWAHSLKDVASKGGRFHSVKYAKVSGQRQELTNAPRVLVGLSTEEILRLAPQWRADALRIHSDVRVRELAESIQRQLIVQMRLAKKNNKEEAYKHIRSVVEIAKQRTKKIPDDAPRATSKDPVIEKINSLLTFSSRDELYAKAKGAQEAFEAAPPRAEWKKDLNEALSGIERANLEKHLKKVEPLGDTLNQLNLFMSGGVHTLNKHSLPILAGGVPTRLWRRLQVLQTIEPPKKDEEKLKGGGGGEPPHTEGSESSHRLDAAGHLALITKASGVTAEKYAALDTRGKRIWSFIKEKGIRALVSSVGAAIGSTFALALCAGALPSMLIALGGAVAGSLLGHHLLKKYYYDKHPDKDHTKDRARVATIQNLARWAQQNPYSFAKYYSGPQGEALLKREIERKVFMRNLAGNALAVGVGTLAGLEVRTGGQFTKTLLTGDFDKLWQLFYCPPTTSTRGVPRAGTTLGAGYDGVPLRDGVPVGGLKQTPPNSLGRGMYAQGSMYTFEAPRARLPAWLHQQCIGRCSSTAPWGYHTWNPGRISSSGEQLYALRYTPR